jgi:hypothetical protein
MKRNLLCVLGVIALTVFSAFVTGTYRNDAIAAPPITVHLAASKPAPMVPVPRANTYVYRP